MRCKAPDSGEPSCRKAASRCAALSRCITGAALALVLAAAAPAPADQIEAEAARILASMSVEDKVGQIIMPDIAAITPADVAEHRFGAILNGGNSKPGNNVRAPPAAWLALADAMWDASTAPRAGGGPIIPTLWATDAVHGHNNVVGATLFPHNIGLGATRDADLVRAIGRATAREIIATGLDWSFAPTIAVATDPRWGRTYESFSADPAVVASLGRALVEGLQGLPGQPAGVLATAKHFVGDGGTGGVDQGDVRGDVNAILAVHGAPYPPVIAAGVQTVMASFSSINGVKMHGNAALLTGLLKDRMGFDGLVVGDWNGHGRVPGCSNARCPQSIVAGLDMFMVPEDWRALKANTLADVKSGAIPMTRLDDAVRRILRVKLRFDAWARGRPSARAAAVSAGIGHRDHRALARLAVARSLVLLKNNGGVLPIRRGARVLVAGDGADSVAMQAGGWTISWQGGGDLTNADFPGAQTIWAGLRQAIEAAGGTATLSADGRFSARPDVAVVIFGETPYAEFVGDVASLELPDQRPLALMRQLRAQGVPVVAVLLSGRPLWTNRELNAADAFVAAWLPGSEGGGIADVLLAGGMDFSGRLPFDWPAAAIPDNRGGRWPAPIFAIGHGLSYAAPATLGMLSEAPGTVAVANETINLMRAGVAIAPYRALLLGRDGQAMPITGPRAATRDGTLTIQSQDRTAQEDARRLVWLGPGAFALRGPAAAGSGPLLHHGQSLVITYAVTAGPQAGAALTVSCGQGCTGVLDITSSLRRVAGTGWRTARIAPHCFRRVDGPAEANEAALAIRSEGPLDFSLAGAAVGPAAAGDGCGL